MYRFKEKIACFNPRTRVGCDDLTVADIYDICEHYCHDNSGATQHAIKKLLCPGKRGHKDELKDLREAVFSINRRIAILERKTNDKLP